MSTMNDYTFKIMVQQRHDEFLADAANDRLARLATSGRPNWRQRIHRGLHHHAGPARRSHTSRPAQVH